MVWLLAILVAAAALALAVWLYILRQGDAKFEFIVNQRTEVALKQLTTDSAEFSCKVPFVNKGTQDGTIMDAFPRHFLPCEQYDQVEVQSRLSLESAPREDGYWEAIIIKKGTGDAVVITVKLVAGNGDIRAALQEMPDMPVDIVYQVVARSLWYIHKARFVLTGEEVRQALQAGISAN